MESPHAAGLGKAINIRRVELGLSRNDLRDRSGLSYPYVAELEKGTKSPSSRALDAIARALELRPYELLERAEMLAGAGSTLPLSDPPAPSERSQRWSGPATAPVTGSAAVSAGPITEERVREIVREELRRLVAEGPE